MLNEEINAKWQPILEHPELDAIKDPHKRAVTALVLENTERLSEKVVLGPQTHCLTKHQLTTLVTAQLTLTLMIPFLSLSFGAPCQT